MHKERLMLKATHYLYPKIKLEPTVNADTQEVKYLAFLSVFKFLQA